MSESHKFRNVSLTDPLFSAVEDYIEKDPRYRSVAEFVAEATRLRLDRLGRLAACEKRGGK